MVKTDLQTTIEGLHAVCGATVAATFSNAAGGKISDVYLFAAELDTWCRVVSERQESGLYAMASKSFVVALLNVCQGQYRNSFKGLRLVLELCLQGVYLSANVLDMQEWLSGTRDTIWATLTGENGPLSKRFCNAFFRDLSEHSSGVHGIARSVYRELSECIHGNVPNHIPLKDSFEFDEEALSLWLDKCQSIRLVTHFALCLRYMTSLSEGHRAELEPFLIDNVGHIEAIRLALGGPAS